MALSVYYVENGLKTAILSLIAKNVLWWQAYLCDTCVRGVVVLQCVNVSLTVALWSLALRQRACGRHLGQRGGGSGHSELRIVLSHCCQVRRPVPILLTVWVTKRPSNIQFKYHFTDLIFYTNLLVVNKEIWMNESLSKWLSLNHWSKWCHYISSHYIHLAELFVQSDLK